MKLAHSGYDWCTASPHALLSVEAVNGKKNPLTQTLLQFFSPDVRQ